MSDEKIIDTEKLSLEEWLDLVFNPPKDAIFLNSCFPTDKHRDEYIATINNRSEYEVRKLLQAFLVKSTSFDPWDELNYDSLVNAYTHNRELFERMSKHTYYIRLVNFFKVSNRIYPWEGNTWILDLLPHSPRVALEALNAYLFAHIPVLPDKILQGLFDAAEIIRAKFIGQPGTQKEKVDVLCNLSPKQFEQMTERLYSEMGYDTRLTQDSHDGGIDLIARINEGAKQEFLIVQCKRHIGTVAVSVVRDLYGVVSSKKANRGVLVTCGKFSSDARKFANLNFIQLIDGDSFVTLLNEHIGSNWPLKLDRLFADSEKHSLDR